MKRFAPSRLVMGSAIVAFAAVSMGQPLPVQQGRPSISLQELAERGVVGTFGSPLGTIIELKGTIVPNPQRGKGESSAPATQVDEINGRQLDKPMVTSRIRFQAERGAEPRVGDRFHAFGYETGGYAGIVPGAAKFQPPRQDRGFGFTTHFDLLKVEWARRP